MYSCKINPILGHDENKVLKDGERFLKEWIANSKKTPKGRPFVRVTWFKSRLEIYLDRLEPHWKRKHFDEQVKRYRLLPCVRELLERNKDDPNPMNSTREHNKWSILGLTPIGKSFLVIISQFKGGKYVGEFFLNTCYPWGK